MTEKNNRCPAPFLVRVVREEEQVSRGVTSVDQVGGKGVMGCPTSSLSFASRK